MTDGNGKNGWGFFAGTYDKPYFYWPSLLLGIFGAVNNLFVLTVLINRQRTPHLTILKSIAFSDLGISLNLLVLLNCPDHFKLPENILGDLACPVFFSLYLVFALAATSGWHIVWFTLDIYGGQGNYNWHRLLFGSKIRIRLSLLFLWVLGFTIQNSSLWNYNIDRESHTCVLTWKSDAVRYVLSGALVLIFIIILPLVIMLWCYISLFKKLYHAKNYYQLKSETIQSLENEEKYKMVRKFLISSSCRTICLFFTYFVSWVPVVIIWLSFVFEFASDHLFDTWYNQIVEILPFLNAAINPILYGWSWFEFRDVVKAKFANIQRPGTDYINAFINAPN